MRTMKREKDIWTASRLKAYQICPRKEYLRYRMNLAPKTTKANLAFGTAIHKGIETRDIDQAIEALILDYPRTQEEAVDQETARVMVTALLENYFTRYPPFENHLPETQFRMPMIAHHSKSTTMDIAGKMDDLAWIDGQWWLVEYKTATRLDGSYFDRLYLDSQISLYMMAAARMGYPPVGVIYRVIRKPAIRRKQSESLDAFLERMEKTIADNPDYYFMENKYYRSDADLQDFQLELYKEARQANRMAKDKHIPHHTVSCSLYGGCEYLPLCTGTAGATDLYEVREPHEELRKEQNA